MNEMYTMRVLYAGLNKGERRREVQGKGTSNVGAEFMRLDIDVNIRTVKSTTLPNEWFWYSNNKKQRPTSTSYD